MSSRRTALVTGGSRGIGRACAAELVRRGLDVVITATSKERLEHALGTLKEEGTPARWGYVLDVRSQDNVDQVMRQLVEQHPACDVLVNSAGVAAISKAVATPPELWREIIEVNLTGTYLVTHAWLRESGAVARGWGRIVNLASTAGKQAAPMGMAYSASKHGVIGMTKTLAIELAGTGVTVNAVCPGLVDTDMSIEVRWVRIR